MLTRLQHYNKSANERKRENTTRYIGVLKQESFVCDNKNADEGIILTKFSDRETSIYCTVYLKLRHDVSLSIVRAHYNSKFETFQRNIDINTTDTRQMQTSTRIIITVKFEKSR